MKYSFQKMGTGNEGTVYQMGNYVIKMYKKNYHANLSLNEKIKEIDPDRRYFMWYEVIKPTFVIMNKLKPLKHPKRLTKSQYRHLQSAMNLLEKHHIYHGDLPDNVMVHPETHMPIIIDFDRGHLQATRPELDMDRMAFLKHFAKEKTH